MAGRSSCEPTQSGSTTTNWACTRLGNCYIQDKFVPRRGRIVIGRARGLASQFAGDITRVAAVTGVSVGALGIVDILLARELESAAFGEYQLVRFGVPLVAIISLGGIDQAIPRVYAGLAPQPSRLKAAIRSLVTALLLGSVVAISLAGIEGSSALVWLGFGLAPLGLVLSFLAASTQRASGFYLQAALTQQGYRLIFSSAVLVALAIPWISDAPVIPLLVGSSVVAGIVGIRAARRRWTAHAEEDTKRLMTIGIPLTLAAISLGGMDWIDQTAVAVTFGSIATAGQYAAAKAYLIFPFVAISTVVGFILLPEFARMGSESVGRLLTIRRLMATAIGGIFLIAIVGVLVSRFPSILPTELSPLEVWLFLGIALVRLVSVLPSSLLGAFAGPRILLLFAGSSLCLLAVEFLVVLASSRQDPIRAGLAGLGIAVVSRFVLGSSLAGLALLQHRRHTQTDT